MYHSHACYTYIPIPSNTMDISMGSKHNILTEDEIKASVISKSLDEIINNYIVEHPEITPEELKILDWGCGRGKTVFLLRKMGYTAFGIDIDEKTLKNGYPLFEKNGLDPSKILFHVDKIKSFSNNYFHIIFSEHVVEHIQDLEYFAKEQQRLMKPGGMGLHTFPGSKNIVEPHLKIPYVH